jgi:hypothetical protein
MVRKGLFVGQETVPFSKLSLQRLNTLAKFGISLSSLEVRENGPIVGTRWYDRDREVCRAIIVLPQSL